MPTIQNYVLYATYYLTLVCVQCLISLLKCPPPPRPHPASFGKHNIDGRQDFALHSSSLLREAARHGQILAL